ncbi:hypothetical protein OG311_01870 [Streptomyces sp. NBC_01343]|uniref:hypothetical protein n=1 Tax=Streptomyces sp. NBC_01343 TaxID=2903832 RepID=UPI002E0F7850|nr:hypothetical protein OG311_01870 [Streptomyces sp. NBC_01343]
MTITSCTSWRGMTRRGMLGAALAAGAAVPLAAAAGPARADPGVPAAGGPGAARLVLPVPTGPRPVGTVQLHLVDRSRSDDLAGLGALPRADGHRLVSRP